MKLLYIYRYALLGGVTTQLANRLRFLEDQVEVHFAFLEDQGGSTVFEGYPHVRVCSSMRALVQLISGDQFDLISVIDTPEAYAALRKARYTGAVVNEVHTTTTNLRYLERINRQRIDAFVVPSQYMKRRLREEYGIGRAPPCFQIPNCVDTDVFRSRVVTSVPNYRIIAWVGKLDDHKNWKWFLKIASTMDEIAFWMVGGETASDETVRQLFALAGQFNVLKRLRWLPRVEYSMMPVLYSQVAQSGGVLLSTSTDESFGMVAAEALACGCPIVAPRSGAISEVLGNTLSCCLYPSGDQDAALHRVSVLLGNSEHRQRCHDEGRRQITACYSLEAVARKYLPILKAISDSSSGSGPQLTAS